MSFTIINGKKIENLDYPCFFEPKSPKYKRNILFADNSGNIHFEIEELDNDIPKKNIENSVSVLGKRKFTENFDVDDERYGQHISDDFFNNHIGHNVIQEIPKFKHKEILDWCYKYLASKTFGYK